MGKFEKLCRVTEEILLKSLFLFFRLKNYFGTSDFIAMSSEIPLKKWKDQGNSKIKWSYGFKIWVDLFNIKRTYK